MLIVPILTFIRLPQRFLSFQLYKFYKREIRSIPPSHLSSLVPDHCDVETGSVSATAYGVSLQSAVAASANSNGPGRAVLVPHSNNNNNNPCQASAGQSASLICYSSRALHPYYYHIEESGGTIVAYAPEHPVIIEDSPPSYEMALLCPSVAHHQYANAFINAPIQVILPKEQSKEKSLINASRMPETASREATTSEANTSAEVNHSAKSASHDQTEEEHVTESGRTKSPESDRNTSSPTN